MRIALFVFLAGCNHSCDPQPPSPDSACASNGGADPECVEVGVEYEPNDDTSHANILPPAGAVPIAFNGRIGRGTDVFVTTGKQPSSGHPRAHVEYEGKENALRLCMFVACTVGKTGLFSKSMGDASTACPSGGWEAHRPEGMLGCCTLGKDVSVSVSCDAKSSPMNIVTPPDFRAHIVVERANDELACTKYSVSYQF